MDFTFSSYLLEIIYFIITIFLVCGYFIFQKKTHTLSTSIFYSFFFGFIFNIFSLSWLYSVYPLPWVAEGLLQIAALVLVHLLMSLVSAVPFIIVGAVFHFTRKNTYLSILLIPFSFVVAEIMRAYFLSILFLGKESTLGIHWVTGNIGQALTWTPFIELAYIGGVFTLTWATVSLIYPFFVRKEITYWYVFLLLPLLLTTCIHFFIPTKGPTTPLHVLLVGTSFTTLPTEENAVREWKYRMETLHGTLVSFASQEKPLSPILIALPEDAQYISFNTQAQQKEFRIAFPESILVDGNSLPFGASLRNYTVFYDAKDEATIGRGKTFLFPFNEYVPYVFETLFSLVVGNTFVQEYKKEHSYTRDAKMVTYATPFGNVGSLICSEIISYKTIETLKKESPDIVVAQSYLSIFHNSPLFYMTYFSATKIMAAQVRTPVIVSVQDAPSMIISARGKILVSFEAEENGAKGKIVEIR